MTFGRHLADDRLFDCYLSVRAGEHLDPPDAEHLADCPRCGARYDELVNLMSELREAGDAELDRVFSADDLQRQRLQIARRVEHIGRSARVLPFRAAPAASVTPTPGTSRRLPRWVAGAAAAGLVVGMAAGLSFDGRRSPRPRETSSVASLDPVTAPSVGPIASVPPAAASRDDTAASVSPLSAGYDRDAAGFPVDAFLYELETAADQPRTAELAAYDALTPTVRGISVSLSVR